MSIIKTIFILVLSIVVAALGNAELKRMNISHQLKYIASNTTNSFCRHSNEIACNNFLGELQKAPLGFQVVPYLEYNGSDSFVYSDVVLPIWAPNGSYPYLELSECMQGPVEIEANVTVHNQKIWLDNVSLLRSLSTKKDCMPLNVDFDKIGYHEMKDIVGSYFRDNVSSTCNDVRCVLTVPPTDRTTKKRTFSADVE